MREKKRPEILAPAGSMESLKAAIAAGCDAVYMGGARFGARAYAQNPLPDEMLQAIRTCHRYGVSLYMTVNTLLKEKELKSQLYDFLLPCVCEGLDAVIVQDVGVMRYIHEQFPDLEIHASTQMTITMGCSGDMLKQYGVTRLVPARELTLQEIRQMGQDTTLEREIFVHGALCYCYSGQCLFSSMLGGRSGNRGRCAQPCRQKYTCMETGEKGYLLSPRENCNLAYIGDLMEAGVDSFKIEGRMKRPEYVALVTSLYRKYTDRYMKLGQEKYQTYQKEHDEEWQEDLRQLGELYNREGFSAGYLEGKSGVPLCPWEKKMSIGEMLARKRPRHGGIRVGSVVFADSRSVAYRLERKLHPQDVVEFRNARQETIYEYTLGEAKHAGEVVEARYQKGLKISVGDEVYRTKDAALLEDIRERYILQEAKLQVDMEWMAKEGEPAVLTICETSSGESVTLTGEVCQKAQKRAATEEEIRKLLCQTGDTCFAVNHCQVDLTGELFLPVGAVKTLRRQGLQVLQDKLEGRKKRNIAAGKDNIPVRAEDTTCVTSLDADKENIPTTGAKNLPVNIATVLYSYQAELALQSSQIQEIYLRTEEMSEKQLRMWITKGNQAGKKMYLMMPLIFRKAIYEQEKAKVSPSSRQESIYHMKGLAGFVIRNLESFCFLTKEAHISPDQIITDANLYVTNSQGAEFWKEQGVRGCTLPLELTAGEMETFRNSQTKEAILYGYIPLMVSAQCLCYNTEGCAGKKGKPGKILTLQDGKGRKFYVYAGCKYCYNMIYHGDPLVLEQEKKIFQDMGVTRFRYDLTLESKEQSKQILSGVFPKGQKGHFYHGMM